MKSGRYTEVSFDLTEGDFKYLGGLDRHMLETVLGMQFPIEIIDIKKKKRRGLDKHYYRVCLSIHKSDMKDLEATLKHEYPKDHGYYQNAKKMNTEDKYSLLASDCIHAYSESLIEE